MNNRPIQFLDIEEGSSGLDIKRLDFVDTAEYGKDEFKIIYPKFEI